MEYQKEELSEFNAHLDALKTILNYFDLAKIYRMNHDIFYYFQSLTNVANDIHAILSKDDRAYLETELARIQKIINMYQSIKNKTRKDFINPQIMNDLDKLYRWLRLKMKEKNFLFKFSDDAHRSLK